MFSYNLAVQHISSNCDQICSHAFYSARNLTLNIVQYFFISSLYTLSINIYCLCYRNEFSFCLTCHQPYFSLQLRSIMFVLSLHFLVVVVHVQFNQTSIFLINSDHITSSSALICLKIGKKLWNQSKVKTTSNAVWLRHS